MRRGELHRVLSAESISILAQAYGAGRTIRIPSSTASAQRFEILIGLSETSRLVDSFGGGQVYLPGLPQPSGLAQAPSLEEVERLSRTLAPREIALKLGCSERSIFKKLRRIRNRTNKETNDD